MGGGYGKREEIPTLDEIKRYFNPGELVMVPYFMNGSSNSKERVVIGNRKRVFQSNSIGRYIKRVVEHNHGKRLIIIESDEDLEKVVDVVKKRGLIPVVMKGRE